MIKIGEFVIMAMKGGKVWIRYEPADGEPGEGGAFKEAELAEAIGQFFAERF